MVSVTVRLIIWGGGGGIGAGGGAGLSWDGGTGWVGKVSGRALGIPAPARLDTDWMTGIEVSAPDAFETWDVL